MQTLVDFLFYLMALQLVGSGFYQIVNNKIQLLIFVGTLGIIMLLLVFSYLHDNIKF